MGEERDIDEIILKVLTGTASDEENKQVESWLQASNNNRFQFKKLQFIWDNRSSDSRLIDHEEQKAKIWKAYSADSRFSKNTQVVPFYRMTWVKVAVMLAVILIPIWSLFMQHQDIVEEEAPITRVVTKSNPTGQKSLIQLSEGTKVWLNSDSRISYSERFSDSLRLVHLEGEAYFDVVRDSLRPFVVVFDSLRVTVLGTEFNVTAFEAAKELRITLVDGSVKVTNVNIDDNLILVPGTGLVYTKETQYFQEFSESDHPELFRKATEWRNGKLVFDGRNFEDFVLEIKRWYGVQVHVKGVPPSGWNIRASFENELLTNVMDAVSYNKGFTYTLSDKELTIKFKQKQ